MKVFISWSGELSRSIGEVIKDWLPCVLQHVKPFFTPNDIEKGSRWAADIAQELEASSVGIFCLTKENSSSPWILFEAGAISKKLGASSVCPLLFNMTPSDIVGPLAQFQATAFSKDEIYKVIQTINTCSGESKIPDTTLSAVFDKWWPELESKINKAIQDHATTKPAKSERTDRELLEEILQLSRLQTKKADPLDLFGDDHQIGPSTLLNMVVVLERVSRSLLDKENHEKIAIHLRALIEYVQYTTIKSKFPMVVSREILERMESVKRELVAVGLV